MHELQNAVVHDAAPYKVTYNTFIGVYAGFLNKFNKDAPFKAEKVLRDMFHCTTTEIHSLCLTVGIIIT